MTQLLTTGLPQPIQDSPQRVLLRRRGAVYLPAPVVATDIDTSPGVHLLEADLIDRGWLLAPDLRDALTRLGSADLIGVGSALIADCDALIGNDRPHVPLFRGFPVSTPANTAAFFVDRVLSSWFQRPDQTCVLCNSDGTVNPVNPCGHLVCSACFDGADFSACPICHRRIALDDPFLRPAAERNPSKTTATPQRLRVLHLGDDADTDALTELRTLLARPTSLPPADVADLMLLLDTRNRDDLLWVPAAVPGRETKARLLGWLLADINTPALTVCGDLIDTATDVLRLLVVLSGGGPSLIERPRFTAIPRPLRRAALGWLDRIELTQLVEDMRRNERAWIRLGERLHPGEFGRYLNVVTAFAVLRGTDVSVHGITERSAGTSVPDSARLVDGRIRVTSLGGQVEQSIANQATGMAAQVLAARRPGELVRRLDHLLRANVRQADNVLATLREVAPRVAPAVLLSALGQLRTRATPGKVRAFFPASKASVAHIIPDERPILSSYVVADVVEILNGELLRRAALLPRVDRAVIDADLDGLVVPFAQRTAARSLLTLARGSVLPLPTGRHLRLFCHWMENPDQRVDLDLSVALFDTHWRHVGTCDYTHLRMADDGAVHSGDLTSAPAPLGASEFVDLDLQVLAGSARYAVMVVFSYNSVPFTDLAEAFAGWMVRADKPTDGEVFDPRTVEQRFDLAGPSKATLPMVIDIQERTARWLDVAPRVTGDNHAVHRHHNELAAVGSALVESFERGTRVTIGEIARIHAAARANEVMVRDRDGQSLFVRDPGENVAHFADRITTGAGAEGVPAAADVATAALQMLARGDLPAPDGAEVYALHPAGVDASKVRLREISDFVADLAPTA